MFYKALVVLATVSAALATVFVTAPVASTTFSGGKEAEITWQESGTPPTLAEFSLAKISIYAGNSQQQTLLQTLNASIDVSKQNQLAFTPDASIGPNSSEYFIRFESLSLRDANQPQFPALAFSAKFTLTNMTGAFSAQVNSQIAGQSTAPLASQTATTKAAVSTTSATTTSKAASSTTAAPSAKATVENGAMDMRVGWTVAALSALVGVAMF